MTKRKNPSPENSGEGCPKGLSRLSEMPSLLGLRHTLGNDSVLQCALHQYLNGSYWYSVASPVADSAPDKRRINSKRAGNNFPPFPCVLSGYGWRGSANNKGNRSSPLYAICLNWIHEIQFVDFDSKLFYGRHCQIEPDGEHPTSSERNRRHLSIRL